MVAWDKITRVCPVCRMSFAAERRTAVYCSARCRQRAHRKPPIERRIKEFYEKAHDGLQGLIMVGDRGLEALRAQTVLRALIIECIQSLPDSTRRKLYDQIREDFYRLS
jgi:hypothetical protein